MYAASHNDAKLQNVAGVGDVDDDDNDVTMCNKSALK